MKRIIHISFLCCLTCLLFSCGHHKSGESMVKQYNIIDSLLVGNDTITPQIPITELLFYNEIADSISEITGLYFLYIVNADCSNCIAGFLRFIDLLYSSGSTLRTFAVVNVSYSRNLSFYAKQAGNQSFFQTINVSEDCWNDKVMTDFYELYLMKDSCIVKRYLTQPSLD